MEEGLFATLDRRFHARQKYLSKVQRTTRERVTKAFVPNKFVGGDESVFLSSAPEH